MAPQLLPPDHSAAPLRVLTPAEVATFLGVTQRTVRRLVATGLFPPPVRFGHRTRGWFSFELSLVVDARIRGALDPEVRVVVERIIENRREAPLLATPRPLSPVAVRR